MTPGTAPALTLPQPARTMLVLVRGPPRRVLTDRVAAWSADPTGALQATRHHPQLRGHGNLVGLRCSPRSQPRRAPHSADRAGFPASPALSCHRAALPAVERAAGIGSRPYAGAAPTPSGDQGPSGTPPSSVREIADYLLLQSHSAVGLVDRAEAAGVVRRRPDPDDARVVRVELTEKGDKLVTELTAAHLASLYELAAALHDLLPPQDSSKPSQ